jgi:ABC-type multidrug transport system ATPase subunit
MLATVSGLFFIPFFGLGRVRPVAMLDDKTRPAKVQVSKLTKRFGNNVVIDKLSFNITQGESVAIWGSNGVGKTTILHCLLGLLSYEGSATINGLEVRENGKTVRTIVGFVPQELNLHENLTLFDTMHLYSRLKKSPENLIERRLEQFDLVQHSRKRVGQLSGGLKQRLALAIALLSDPPILILDEPTAGLDMQSRESLMSIISTLKKEGKTLIFASHRSGDVLRLADRILIIEEGKVRESGSPAEMLQHIREAVRLRIYLPTQQISQASDILIAHGFVPTNVNSAILVDVSMVKKAEPITLLTEAGFSIRDFEMEPVSTVSDK